MGLLWDMFKRGVSLDEAHVCLGELVKFWKVFCSCVDEDVELRGISIRRVDSGKCLEDIWELRIAYVRDDYDCSYRAIYNVSRSNYSVIIGDDLEEDSQKRLRGYLFNTIKSVGILNNKLFCVGIRFRNSSNTISVISTVSDRSAVIFEGNIDGMANVSSLVRKNVDNFEESSYNSIISL